MGNTWIRLAKHEITSGTASQLLGSWTGDYRRLKVIYNGISSGQGINGYMRFNNDSSSDTNYTIELQDTGGSNTAYGQRTMLAHDVGTATTNQYAVTEIENKSNQEKLVIGHVVNSEGTNASTGLKRRELVGKWIHTGGSITSVQIDNGGSGAFGVGSYLIILGIGGATITDEKTTISNVEDGTRFYETDTRKIYRSSSLKTGCKAYYKFDSTSGGLTNQATSTNGFTDGLGSNVDGTVTGATTSTDKKLGTNSYLFDGNDYVVCGSTSDFNFAHKTGHTVTVAFWFKQSNAPSGGEIIVGTASTSTGGSTGFYLGTHTSGRIFFSLYDGDATTEPINDYLTGNNIIPDTSNWYHYVFTFDDSNLTIYRNGSQVATTSYTASSTTTGNATNSLTLGKAPNASGNYLDGRLDDMGIWDRVLSTSEISELYNSGTGKTVDTAMVWTERGSA